MKIKTFVRRLGLGLLAGLNLASAHGYNDSLLARGDDAVLIAPLATFRTELARISVPPTPFQAVTRQKYDWRLDGDEINAAAEQDDLRAALAQAGAAEADVGRIATNQLVRRHQLAIFQQKLAEWENSSPREYDTNGHWTLKPTSPPPRFPQLDDASELPPEFADYLEGVIAWQNPAFLDKSVARDAWEKILNRPPADRHFKSTWAAFMLAKSWEKQNPDKAIADFEKVRALAKAGFADSAGLAASSYGWEARIYLEQKNYERATELYLQQLATGDDTAYESLCCTMRSLFGGSTESFPALAKNPLTRRVVTAYIVSTKALQHCLAFRWSSDPEMSARLVRVVNDWLAAVEAIGVNDPQLTEELALAAYQNQQWELAQTWITRARSSPTAQWLQAKLLLRTGKINQAGSFLARVEALFPLQAPGTNEPIELKDHLTAPDSEEDDYGISAARQIRGELGIYHLARGDYELSLDYFLRAELWKDAAYIAERMLTVDELKAYIDRQWPQRKESTGETDANGSADLEALRSGQSQDIRDLLARRLTRELRGNEAREYFSAGYWPQFDALMQALTIGWNESLPAWERAKALFTAATVTRSDGMNLLGTEVAPDWRLGLGRSEDDLSASLRTNETFTLFPASADELRREVQHKPDPDVRFHYRYQAAFLGWEAAKLMPNNSDETARVLWTAGSWLKAQDPQTADLFYKSLVRRCRKTALGAEADRIRWFPELDANGNIIPRRPRVAEVKPTAPPEETSAPGDEAAEEFTSDYPVPGVLYVIHAGDSLAAIAHAACVWGQPVSAAEIINANGGIDPTQLRVGQKILIPKPNHDPPPE